MPLTRHLYEIDEVKSAMQVCLHDGDEAALFWLWELHVSREENENEDNCIRRYVQHRVAHAFLAKAQCPSKNLVKKKRPAVAKLFVASLNASRAREGNELWMDLDDACARKNKIAIAWYLKAAQSVLSEEEIWRGLSLCLPLLRENRKGGLVDQMIASVEACGSTTEGIGETTVGVKAKEKAKETATAKKRWDSWAPLIGRRAARLLAIPEKALCPGTTRGDLPSKYTNIADIREPVELLSEGCKFWQETLKERGITMDDETNTICFPNDDVLEQFYEEFFPDDIPDEWSAADQQKSHGRGMKKS